MDRAAFILLLVLAVFSASAAGAAQSGPYLGLNAGANLFAADSENQTGLGTFNLGYQEGYQSNLTLGYRLAPGSAQGTGRVELEVGYRHNGIDQIEFSDGKFSARGKTSVWDLMFNSFGEYPNPSRWTPYVGVGIGLAKFSLRGVEVAGTPVANDEDLVLAYQAGCGLDYAFSQAVQLDIGYRFFDTTDAVLTDGAGMVFDAEYRVHNLQLGIRFFF